MRRPHSARAHSMQAAAAARRARRHPHRRSAAPRQRWPRVRAARRTKEHELQVDGLHRSPRSGRTGSASATWWFLRRQCRATRSAGWRGRRPTTGGTACPATTGAAKTENACTFGAAPLQGCKAHGTRRDMVANVVTPGGRHRATCQRRRQSSHQDAVCGEGDGEGGPVRCPPAAPRLLHAAFAPRQLCRGSGAPHQSGAERALVRLRDAGRLGSGSVALALSTALFGLRLRLPPLTSCLLARAGPRSRAPSSRSALLRRAATR